MMVEQEIILHKIAKTISEIAVKDNKYLTKLFLRTNFSFKDFFLQLINILRKSDNKSEKIKNILSSDKLIFRTFTEIAGLDRIVTVSVSFNSFSRKNLKLLDRFFISESLFEKLRQKYFGLPKNFERDLFKLLYRYTTLWQYQSFLSEENLKLFKEELDCSLECFSCPLYRVYENYCSMFEEDRIFGSLGNFFSFQPYSQNLCMEINPPYISDIIDKTIDKIIEIASIDGCFCFILTIPDWFMEKIVKLYERNLTIIELHPERVNFTLYTKNFQKINYYKTSLTILIIRNKKGEKRFPISETFIQRLNDINKRIS
jgi:hypothetical protein